MPPDTLLIKELPLNERPQQRLRDYGPNVLSATDLLACLLQAPNALSQAQELMRRFGLKGLLRASIPELCQVPGIGSARAVLIKAALELRRRSVLDQPDERYQIRSPADAAEVPTSAQKHTIRSADATPCDEEARALNSAIAFSSCRCSIVPGIAGSLYPAHRCTGNSR